MVHGDQLVYGANVVSQRQKMESDFLNATTLVEDPVGFTIRYTNWTAHPSQTTGGVGCCIMHRVHPA